MLMRLVGTRWAGAVLILNGNILYMSVHRDCACNTPITAVTALDLQRGKAHVAACCHCV